MISMSSFLYLSICAGMAAMAVTFVERPNVLSPVVLPASQPLGSWSHGAPVVKKRGPSTVPSLIRFRHLSTYSWSLPQSRTVVTPA